MMPYAAGSVFVLPCDWLLPGAAPVFPTITAVLSFAAAPVDFTSRRCRQATDRPPAYLGESDSAKCDSHTAEREMQKRSQHLPNAFTVLILASFNQN